jgi:hypothetical protein
MSDVRPDIPPIDATVTARNLHEVAEAVAVPCYNWVIMPMIAAIDGILRLDSDGRRPARVTPDRRRKRSPAGTNDAGPGPEAVS